MKVKATMQKNIGEAKKIQFNNVNKSIVRNNNL